jgi:anaerobic selenocysteine-containing dehydrogenase
VAEHKVTFCRICEASCGLIAEVDGERVLRLAPDPDHVLSRGFACVKGTRYVDVHGSPDRLRTPLKRIGDQFVPISWPQALAEIGAKVRALRAQHGDDSVGMYVGNPAALSPLHLVFSGAFAQGLRSRHLYTSGSQDCNNKFVASEELFGSPLLQPIPDLDRLRCFIVIGSNPAVSQFTFVHAPRLMERLKARERDGARIFFVNPRRTESARELGEQMFIRPGSDLFMLLAFARELFVSGHVRPEFAKYADGVDALREAVMPWSPERVAPSTGIAPDALRSLVSTYVAADGAAIFAGTGVNQGPYGTLAVWLVHAIQLLSGNLDRAGGTIVTRTMQRAARIGYPSGDAIEHRYSRFGNQRSVMDSLPAGIMPDEILTPGPGQLRALIVSAGNPLLSCPNSARMEEALRALELVVSIDLFRNETGNHAHYLLPATSFLERSDIPLGMGGYQPEPYGQFAEPVVAPLGEAKDEWWIFTELARACATPLRNSAPFQWYLEQSTRAHSVLPKLLRFAPSWAAAASARLHGTSLRALREHRHGVALPAHRHGSFLKRGVLTKTKKVQLAPPRFMAALAQVEAPQTAGTSLTLVTKRERTSHNSWMHNVERFVSGTRATNYLYMHPDDAVARALVDGAMCEVRSASGAVRVPVKISDELLPGTVALPHGWGHAAADGLRVAKRTTGANANVLSADGASSLEPLSGMARLTAIPVEVTAVTVDTSSTPAAK